MIALPWLGRDLSGVTPRRPSDTTDAPAVGEHDREIYPASPFLCTVVHVVRAVLGSTALSPVLTNSTMPCLSVIMLARKPTPMARHGLENAVGSEHLAVHDAGELETSAAARGERGVGGGLSKRTPKTSVPDVSILPEVIPAWTA